MDIQRQLANAFARIYHTTCISTLAREVSLEVYFINFDPEKKLNNYQIVIKISV